ncbi:MAG TPA: hypothetical protein PKW08_10695 [Flavobacteriaceae bacterium]|nr:hypothetical protein [Flavobacteriaceae bacterium]MCB9212065.1 hypothetical protein [Alteromonas sp.]HPF09839.1 hypothetical protein [Flavobacteriaceae bacterium]HQU22043.1 hypothetical protein [Flavobacteriaceae bacterium]HQU64076.1 hypothetical protein [Flavobacteriaceae bacterium]
MTPKNKLLAIFLLFAQVTVLAQDTLKIRENDLETKRIKEGTKQYLVYIEKPDKSILDLSIWERTISFSKFDDKEVIIIEQNWKNQDTTRQRYVLSINGREYFQPIYHYSKNGRGIIEAFNFYRDKIVGADTVMRNSKKDFFLQLEEPTLNWELDVETFQLLPLENVRNFQLNFYHPGSKSAPAYYNYRVVGEEELKGTDGKRIPCWLLKIVYEEGSYATYWIAKNTREMVKMVEHSNGITRYKLKLL